MLVVDNEPSILEGMTALLQGWSCNTLCATSSANAAALIRDEDFTPDIILMDYHLDDSLTGIMALKDLAPLWPAPVPAVVITADRTDEVQDEIRQSAAQHLNKPIKPAALRAMINKLISANRQQEAETSGQT
ncbi:response regulator [Aliamphritea spongicola]|nr:response regulator [Aliamphritea spongicola]